MKFDLDNFCFVLLILSHFNFAAVLQIKKNQFQFFRTTLMSNPILTHSSDIPS